MAQLLRRMNKGILLAGGALVVAALVISMVISTSSPVSVSAQTSPTPTRAATAAATATKAPTTAATPGAAAAKSPTPAAPGKLPANGDSTTFPAVAIALLGAGLIGLGLFARFSFGKSRA